MATIQTRKRAKGTTHTVTVRIRGFKPATETFARKTDAKTWAANTEAAMRARKFRDPKLAEIPLGATLDLYMDKISTHKAASTHQRERITARALLSGLGKETLISEIAPLNVAQYRDMRLKTVGPGSVRKELAMLSHLFRIAAREWGIPVDNPVSAIARPAPPQGRLVFLTEAEAYALAQECRQSKNRQLHAYILTLLQTALRPGAAAGLTCAQINLQLHCIDLGTTKNGDPIRLPLTSTLQAEIKKLLAGKLPGDCLFLPHDAPATNQAKYFREAFEQARTRAGLAHVHLHDLRHTAASHLLMAGVDLRTLAEILGHRTLQMVMRYTHLFYKHKAAALDKIGHLGIKKVADKTASHPDRKKVYKKLVISA